MKFTPEIFNEYNEISENIDTETYNLQAAEIDANAFAKIFLEESTGVMPLFLGYSEKVKQKIFEHTEILKKQGLF